MVRDCFGRAVWVKRITRRRTPAKRRNSPSMPRRAMRNGFSFDRRKVDDISNAMRIPTTVDLQQKNGVCFQKDFGLPDVDRYALCSQ